MRKGTRERVQVRAVLKKRAGVRGQATWPGISACVRECARAGPRRDARKAELTGGFHSTARGNGHAGETVQHADEAGPRGREGEVRAGNWLRQSGPTGQRERGRRHELRGNVANRWSPPVRRRRRVRVAPLGWTGPVWAALGFSIFLEFLIAFLFLFL
jgi:hypothetical protein